MIFCVGLTAKPTVGEPVLAVAIENWAEEGRAAARPNRSVRKHRKVVKRMGHNPERSAERPERSGRLRGKRQAWPLLPCRAVISRPPSHSKCRWIQSLRFLPGDTAPGWRRFRSGFSGSVSGREPRGTQGAPGEKS